MNTYLARLLRIIFPVAVLCVAACGPAPTETFTVSGTLTGLSDGNSITLTNNGTDKLTLTANGTFVFPVKLAKAASYTLTLSATTPIPQSCTSTNSVGTINTNNVTNLLISCGVNVEPAGLVQLVDGQVQQTSLAGQTKEMHKGDTVNEGDTLSSGSKASAKIKLRDGGLITMRQDTQLKIDSYKFNGKQDGTEQSFFSLFKGGFRSVTGLIGKLHKKNYRIVTPNAVIGIRGTDHETYLVVAGTALAKLSPVGTYDKVNSGETTLTNDKGSISILPKQMGFVATADQKPQLQPVNPKLFSVEKDPLDQFNGRWSTKLVCDDTKDKKGLVKGYKWEFDVIVKQGKLSGQYGEIGAPSSATFVGQVQRDGKVDIEARGNTGKTDYTVGRVARGTPFSYQMNGEFSESTGYATRTQLRPCKATFTKQ